MGKTDVTIDLGMLMTKEVTYKGSFRYGVSHPSHDMVQWLVLSDVQPARRLSSRHLPCGPRED